MNINREYEERPEWPEHIGVMPVVCRVYVDDPIQDADGWYSMVRIEHWDLRKGPKDAEILYHSPDVRVSYMPEDAKLVLPEDTQSGGLDTCIRSYANGKALMVQELLLENPAIMTLIALINVCDDMPDEKKSHAAKCIQACVMDCFSKCNELGSEEFHAWVESRVQQVTMPGKEGGES